MFQDCWSQPSPITLCRINLHLGDASSDEGRGMIPPEALALLVEVPIVVSTCFKLPARQGLRNRECSVFFSAPFFLYRIALPAILATTLSMQELPTRWRAWASYYFCRKLAVLFHPREMHIASLGTIAGLLLSVDLMRWDLC